jgi:hypothetical protein
VIYADDKMINDEHEDDNDDMRGIAQNCVRVSDLNKMMITMKQ